MVYTLDASSASFNLTHLSFALIIFGTTLIFSLYPYSFSEIIASYQVEPLGE